MKFNNIIQISETIDAVLKMGRPFSLSRVEDRLKLSDEEAFSCKRDQKSLLLFENALIDCIRKVDWRVASESRKREAKALFLLLETLFSFFEHIHRKEDFVIEHKDFILMSLYLGARIPSLFIEKDESAFNFIGQNELQERFFDFGLTLKMKENEIAIPFEVNPFEYAELSFSDLQKRIRGKKISYEWKGRVVFETSKGGILTNNYSLTRWGITYNG